MHGRELPIKALVGVDGTGGVFKSAKSVARLTDLNSRRDKAVPLANAQAAFLQSLDFLSFDPGVMPVCRRVPACVRRGNGTRLCVVIAAHCCRAVVALRCGLPAGTHW